MSVALKGLGLVALLGVTTVDLLAIAQQTQKPNILVIMGDDIGMWNISAYSHGMMGFKTPNIDSLAKDGAIFSDIYAQQ